MLVPDRRWYEYPFPTAFIGGVTGALGGFFYALANGSERPVWTALGFGLMVFTIVFTACSFIRHIEGAARDTLKMNSQITPRLADEPVREYKPVSPVPVRGPANLAAYDMATKVFPSVFKEWPIGNTDRIPAVINTILARFDAEPLSTRLTVELLGTQCTRGEITALQQFFLQKEWGVEDRKSVLVTQDGYRALEKLNELF